MIDTVKRNKRNHRWNLDNITEFRPNFHNMSDKDVIDAIASQANKTDFIRQCVRFYIKHHDDPRDGIDSSEL